MRSLLMLAVLAVPVLLPSSIRAEGYQAPSDAGADAQAAREARLARQRARDERDRARREAEYQRELARQQARERAARVAAAARAARREAKITAFAKHLHELGVDLKPLFDAANSRKDLSICRNGALCATWTIRTLEESTERWIRVPHTLTLLTAEQLKLSTSEFRSVSSPAGDFLVYMPYKGTAVSREDLDRAGALLSEEQLRLAISRAVVLRENQALQNLN